MTKVFIALAMIFVVWVFTAPLFADFLIVKRPLEKSDAILILGGSSVYLERTERAAELYKNGVSKKIILTDDGERAGWSPVEQRNPPYVDLASRELNSIGVPHDAIEIIKPEFSGTNFEAKSVRGALAERNLRSVLIVTSAYHTKRALYIFENEFAGSGIEIGIESAAAGKQTPQPSFWWISPRGWQMVAGEYVKFVYYWVFG